MNTEIKNMWRKKSWSIPDLLGSKSEYTKIVIGLIQQIASGNANGMDDFPKLEGVFEPRTWREYVPFLKGIGIVGNHNGSLFVVSVCRNVVRGLRPPKRKEYQKRDIGL